MIELTTGVVFLMSSLYGFGQNDGHVQLINVQSDPEHTTSEIRTFTNTQAVQAYLHEQYFDTPILIEVARCESEFRQFDKSGRVIRGRAVQDDIGLMQINEYYHGLTAKNMGLDIYTTEGNVAFAKYLHSRYGLKPWSASKPCWSKSGDLAKK